MLGVVGTLPLFIGAGAIMLPTVVGGGLVSARAEWRKATRAVCIVVAAAPVLLVGKDLVGSFVLGRGDGHQLALDWHRDCQSRP